MRDEAATAFQRVWDREYVRIVRTAFLMTGSREEAEDLAQESFAIAWRKWGHVGTLERPGAWLQVTVGRLALNWRRRRRRQPQPLATPEAGPVEPVLVDPQLTRALWTLTPGQRAVIVLRFYADQSVDQVARGLGKRPGTVRALTSQGLARLRLILDENGVAQDVR